MRGNGYLSLNRNQKREACAQDFDNGRVKLARHGADDSICVI